MKCYVHLILQTNENVCHDSEMLSGSLQLASNKLTNGVARWIVVGRRTCDLGVAGSRPGRDAAAQQP